MSLEYKVYYLEENHFPAVASLYKEVFGRHISLSRLQARFDGSQFEKPLIALLAAAPDKSPAAFFALLPMRFEFNGQVFHGARAVDVMTHPDHRRQKLFTNLGLMARRRAEECGYDFLFTLPNEMARPIFKKALGWQTIQRLQRYQTDGANLPWAKTFSRKEEKGTAFPDGIRFIQASHPELLTSSRWPGFFEYKRASEDSRILTFLHGAAWLQLGLDLKIGDLAPFSPAKAPDLLREVAAFGRKCGCKKIWFESTPFEEAKTWFGPEWKSIKTSQVLALPLREGVPLERLFLTLADLDGF
ncbi:MAG: GNAT family N-acetyltransferase [Bacteroidia bacterium]|nr:GNAT family N-acetyltransferase [Bacteroidia bacterium]